MHDMQVKIQHSCSSTIHMMYVGCEISNKLLRRQSSRVSSTTEQSMCDASFRFSQQWGLRERYSRHIPHPYGWKKMLDIKAEYRATGSISIVWLSNTITHYCSKYCDKTMGKTLPHDWNKWHHNETWLHTKLSSLKTYLPAPPRSLNSFKSSGNLRPLHTQQATTTKKKNTMTNKNSNNNNHGPLWHIVTMRNINNNLP